MDAVIWREFYQSMWIAPAVAIAMASYLAFWRPDVLYIVWPLLVSWSLAPAVAWWISLPQDMPKAKLSDDQTIFLGKLSRKTWRFFETFVGPESHWLPPDNYQEKPRSVVAIGTSPTNMGLSLLANLAAYDFGYISAGRLIERTGGSLQTMKVLERFQGHFYNWYDTKLLLPMQPKYISTVDSGNLAGHLLTLQQGLLELPDQKILPLQAFEGLRHTLYIIKDEHGGCGSAVERVERRKDIVPPEVLAQIDRFQSELRSPPCTLSAAWMLLDQQAEAAKRIIDRLGPDSDDPAKLWIQAYEAQLRDHLDDLALMAPWLKVQLSAVKHGELQAELLRLDSIPSHKEIAEMAVLLMPMIDRILDGLQGEEYRDERDRFLQLRQTIIEASNRASNRIASIEKLALDCGELAEIKYDLLFDESRRLLAIGYNVDDLRRDENCYDLLASEARLSSFVAIAQGSLKQEHWFALGRMLTIAGGELALLSWGGTMFEYLMPQLIMPTYENTLLSQTCRAIVRRQIEYGEQRGVPWGISESGYNMIDVNLIYQYHCVRHSDQVMEGALESQGSRSHRTLEAVGRLGGDEFVALLPEVGDEGDAERVAQRMLDADARADLRRRPGVLRHRQRRHRAVPARRRHGGRPDAQLRRRDVLGQVGRAQRAGAVQRRTWRAAAARSSSSKARCTRRSSATSWCCTTSPRSTCAPRAWSASRR